MHRALIVARMKPDAARDIAGVFGASDRGELPHLIGVSSRSLFQFGDHEKSTVGRFKEGNSPVMQAVEIEAAPLCFKSHGCTERRDCRRIFWPGESDIQVVED